MFNVVSWNVCGLGNPVKRQKVLSHLSRLNSHIACIQETHCNEVEALKLKRQWVGQVVFSPANNRKGGVAILFHKSLNVQIVSTECDADGRWVIANIVIQNKHISVFNIYGPVKPDPDFWNCVKIKLMNLNNTNVIVSGDFNQWLDPFSDRNSKFKFNPDKTHKAFLSAIASRPL